MRSSRRQAASGRSWAWALHCRGDCQGTWRHSVGCRRNRVHVRDALLIQGATGHQQRVPERGWTNRLSVRSSSVVVMVPPTGSKADKAANQGYISWDHSPQHVRPSLVLATLLVLPQAHPQHSKDRPRPQLELWLALDTDDWLESMVNHAEARRAQPAPATQPARASLG